MQPYYEVIPVTGPSVLVSLDEAKKQLKMEDLGDFDDTIIQDCIDAAIEEAANYINCDLVESKYRYNSPCWQRLSEPKKQLISAITSIKYLDSKGATVILGDTTAIEAFATLVPVDRYAKQIYLVAYDNLPSLKEETINAFQVEFTTGYTAATLPKPIKQAIKLLITDNYNFRNTRQRVSSYRDSSRILLEPYKYYHNAK